MNNKIPILTFLPTYIEHPSYMTSDDIHHPSQHLQSITFDFRLRSFVSSHFAVVGLGTSFASATDARWPCLCLPLPSLPVIIITMDYYNDAGFRQYYESMMQESPSSERSSASRGDYFYEYNHDREEAAASRGDYFYGAEPQDVSYEEEEVGIPAGYGYDASVVPAAANAAAVQVMGGGKERKKKKKQKRDPNKPKGWLTAVLTYSNAHRKRAKSENPNASFGDIVSLYGFASAVKSVSFFVIRDINPNPIHIHRVSTGPSAECRIQKSLS